MPRRTRFARLQLAPARARQDPSAARRRQHLGQAGAEKPVRRGRKRPVHQRQRLGPGNHRGGRFRAGATRLSAAPGAARCAIGHADGQRARHPHAQKLRAGAFGRDHPARLPALQVRRPYPCRRGIGDHQRPRGRTPHTRDLRRYRGDHSLRHARVSIWRAVRQANIRARPAPIPSAWCS